MGSYGVTSNPTLHPRKAKRTRANECLKSPTVQPPPALTTMPSYRKNATTFSGYWFRVPVELDELLKLGSLQLKAYLAIQRSIQRDKNQGLVSSRRLAKLIGSGVGHGHAYEAAEQLCKKGYLEAEKRPGQTTRYRNPFEWKAKDNATAGGKTHKDGLAQNSSATSQNVDCSHPGEHLDCTPVGEHQRSHPGEHCCSRGEAINPKAVQRCINHHLKALRRLGYKIPATPPGAAAPA